MKRLWGIRHVRWLLAARRLGEHLDLMRQVGLGIVVSQSDIDYLDAIWRGER